MADEKGLRTYLIDEMDFSERRVERALEKLKSAGRCRTKANPRSLTSESSVQS